MSEKSMGPARSAQRVVDGLTAQGVRYIFGIPGAKVDEVFDVLDDGRPQLVVCRRDLAPERRRS
jgi:acetolactate synthase-1/2/3 large subunit